MVDKREFAKDEISPSFHGIVESDGFSEYPYFDEEIAPDFAAGVDTDDVETRSDWRNITSRTIGDTELLNVGMEHTGSFYEEHDAFFEDMMSEIDALVVEDAAAPWIDFRHFSFYDDISEQAAEHDVDLYQTDPGNLPVMGIESTRIVGGTHALILGLSETLAQSGNIVGSAEPGSLGALGSAALTLGAGAWLLYGTVIGRGAGHLADGMSGNPYMETSETWRNYGFSTSDYREHRIANGIRTIAEEEYYERIGALHGAIHHEGIDDYLDDPSIPRVRARLYDALDVIANPDIREYPENRGPPEGYVSTLKPYLT